MKLEKIKLKWKIFAYIILFGAAIIAIFCFYQIFMLESAYKTTKVNTIDSQFDKVEAIIEKNGIGNPDIDNTLLQISNDHEVAIYLFNNDGDVIKAYNSGDYLSSLSNKENFKMISIYPNKARKFYICFKSVLNKPNPIGGTDIYLSDNSSQIKKYSLDSAIVCCKFISVESNYDYVLVLDARLTPVDPAVETLKNQLLYISLIVVLLSIGFALIIGNRISRPIIKMTKSAKLLADGRRDITFSGKGYEEIYELNKTLNYAVEELNKTNTLQKELLANISHDLKTPLTLIGGYAEMMRDIPDEITPENIQLIVDEVNRLNVLVNDLVNLSRLQARTENFNFEKYDLEEDVKSIVERQRKLREKDNFDIRFNSDGAAFINADRHKIEQVIYNFINNAVNYSGESRIIDIKLEKNNDIVRFSVTDYGIGIREDELSVVWNRYYRVDKGHKRATEGSGLGLSIVKEILDYHKFEYGVMSKYNEGSTFYFEAKLEEN